MLSRLANRRLAVQQNHVPILDYISRSCTSVAKLDEEKKIDELYKSVKEGPQRDLVNFPRPKPRIYGSPVRLGFLPESWFHFLYPKIGVTGPYTLGFGLITYLCSKEIYVMEHEFVHGLTVLVMATFAIKKFGPQVGTYLEKQIDAELEELNSGKRQIMDDAAKDVEAEKLEQWRAEGQKLLFDAKRENVQLQVEAAYRERLSEVFNEVKNRLDYQIASANTVRRVQQKHIVDWIVSNVKKSITPSEEKKALDQCILDLKAIAQRA